MEKSFSLNKNFDRNILVIVCLVGLFRITIEILFRDSATLGGLDFYLDIAFGLSFVITLMVLWRYYSYRLVYFTFYIPLIILLCLTLYDRQGVAGPIETNIYVGIVVIALTMRSKDAMKLSVYLILGTLVTLTFVELKHNFFEDYNDYSISYFNYLFMSTGALFITYYTKRTFERWKRSLSEIRKELSENHTVLADSQSQLKTKTGELEELNRALEQKVNERVALLKNQKEAIKKYLDLTSRELEKEHQGIHTLAKSIAGSSSEDLYKMMLVSSEKLENEMNALVSQLKEER